MMKGYDREEALAFILSRINRNAHPEPVSYTHLTLPTN